MGIIPALTAAPACNLPALPTLFVGVGKCGLTVAVSLGKSPKPRILCKVLCWSEPVYNTSVLRRELLPQHLALRAPESSCPHHAAAAPPVLSFGLSHPVLALPLLQEGLGDGVSPCSAR